jgi:hypothetical protein
VSSPYPSHFTAYTGYSSKNVIMNIRITAREDVLMQMDEPQCVLFREKITKMDRRQEMKREKSE